MLGSEDVTTCGSCGARIRWTTTEAGRAQAVDADPHEDGNTLVWRDRTGRLRSRRARDDYRPVGHETVHMPHVVTCSQPRIPRQRTRPATPQRAPRRGTGRRQPWRRLP